MMPPNNERRAKAAEGSRTPRPVGISMVSPRREAFWSAAALCRFFNPLTCLVILISALYGRSSPAPREAIQKGQTFLLGLFDPTLNLLPEYRGANVYWLFHDNYLAAKVLAGRDPQIATNIVAAIHREGVRKSGKIEIAFGEAEKPLPFRQYQLVEVRRATNKVIRTEMVTDRILEGWENYTDLLLLACIAEKDSSAAHRHWDAAMKMWDGKGFLDAAAKHNHQYSTYKLGLALLTANRLSPRAEPPHGLVERLLAMQDETGGWITDYDAAGKKLGVANVETTCLCILGLEAFSKL